MTNQQQIYACYMLCRLISRTFCLSLLAPKKYKRLEHIFCNQTLQLQGPRPDLHELLSAHATSSYAETQVKLNVLRRSNEMVYLRRIASAQRLLVKC